MNNWVGDVLDHLTHAFRVHFGEFGGLHSNAALIGTLNLADLVHLEHNLPSASFEVDLNCFVGYL